MTARRRIQGNSPYEPLIGFSRAVRVGQHVHVSGTTATDDDGSLVGVGDVYAQTRQCFENVRRALEKAGATLDDVVRTRMYVTDIKQWEKVGKAHGELFQDTRPAATMVEVSGFVHPDMLVEVEADAVLGSSTDDEGA